MERLLQIWKVNFRYHLLPHVLQQSSCVVWHLLSWGLRIWIISRLQKY